MREQMPAAPRPSRVRESSRYAWVATSLTAVFMLPLPACFLAGYEPRTDEPARSGGSDAALPPDAGLTRDDTLDAHLPDAEDGPRLPDASGDAADAELGDGSRNGVLDAAHALDASDHASDADVFMDATGEPTDGALVPDVSDAELPAADACAELACADALRCEAGDDTCVLSCDEPASDPRSTTDCVFVCDGAESCDGICRSELACETSCTGSTECHTRCEEGATCDIRCLGSEACSADCLPGSTCNIACRGASCENIVCKDGAVCVMR